MNTSTVTYSRLTFRGDNDEFLALLVDTLGLQRTYHPSVYDLVQEEGHSLSAWAVCEAVTQMLYPSSSEVTPQEVVIQYLNEMYSRVGYTPRTGLLSLDYYKDKGDGDEVTDDELFDLITIACADTGIILDSIITEWAVFSSKIMAGSHRGGTSIVTKDIRIPVSMALNRMEGVTDELSHLAVEGDDLAMANYYIDMFINPLISKQAITNPEFGDLVMKTMFSRLGMKLSQKTPDEVIPIPKSTTEEEFEIPRQNGGLDAVFNRFKTTLLDQFTRRGSDPTPSAVADIELYLLSEVLPSITRVLCESAAANRRGFMRGCDAYAVRRDDGSVGRSSRRGQGGCGSSDFGQRLDRFLRD